MARENANRRLFFSWQLSLALGFVARGAGGEVPDPKTREVAVDSKTGDAAVDSKTRAIALDPERLTDRSVAVLGVEGQLFGVSDPGRGPEPVDKESGAGVRLAFFGLGLAPNGTVLRADSELAVGSLGGAKSARFSLDVALGGSVLGSKTHALVVLGGMRFDGVFAERFYYTQLELLYLAAGYALNNDAVHVHVGPRLGLVVDGRFNPDADFRRINLFSVGLEAKARSRWVFAELFAGRTLRVSFHPGIPDSPVDTVRGLLCGTLGVALCLEGHAYRADVIVPFEGIRKVSVTQVGLVVGVGL